MSLQQNYTHISKKIVIELIDIERIRSDISCKNNISRDH